MEKPLSVTGWQSLFSTKRPKTNYLTKGQDPLAEPQCC